MAPHLVSLSDVYPLRSRDTNEFAEHTVILTNDSDKPNQNTPQLPQIAPRVGNMQIRWVQSQGVVMPDTDS